MKIFLSQDHLPADLQCLLTFFYLLFYVHFQVISKLHSFLKAVFPEEYAQREVENAEEEKQEEVASPDLSAAAPAKSTPGTIAKEDFLCDVCNNLLYKPTVLTCGHVVCGVGCLDKGKTPSESYECACGVCEQPLVQRPRPCRQLEDLLQSVFGEEYSAREAVERGKGEKTAPEHAALAVEKEKEAAQEAIAPTTAVAPTEQHPPQQAETAALETATEPSSTLPFSSTGQALTGPHAEIYKWLQGKDYTHFGIGCDCCGQFPITGRRYRCTECPETVGFDLCGDCYDRGVASDPNSKAVVGRFNQQHRPEHSMELCRPRLTSLHMLRAANPELSFDQLMYLLQVSAEREENEEEEEEREFQEGEEGGGVSDGEQEQEEVVAEEENDIPMPHGRGPRPVHDSSAQWPSPSSFNDTNNGDQQLQEPPALPPAEED
jgi:hypothetical protein